MDKKEAKKKLMLNPVFGYGLGDLGGDLATAFGTYYRSFYMTNVALMPLALQAIVSPITSIWGFIAVPIYGTLLDKFRAKPGNTYGKLIKILAPLSIISTALAWYAMSMEPKTLAAVMMVITTVINGFIQQLPYLGNVALMGACADNEQEKATMSSTRWTWIKVAQVISPSVAAGLLAMFSSKIVNNAAAPYILTASTMAVLIPIGYYYNVFTTQGLEKPVVATTSKKRITLVETFKTIGTNPPLLCLVICNICTVIASFLIAMMGKYYFDFGVQRPEMLTIYQTASNALGIIGAFATGFLTKKMDLKKAIVIAQSVGVVGLLIAFLGRANVITYILGVSLYQLAEGVDYAVMITMYSSCAVYSEWKTGIDQTASVMSLVSWPLTVGGFFTGIFIPAYLGAIGYDAATVNAGNITSGVVTGLQNAVSLVPLAFYVIAFFIMLFGYKLTGKKMKEMQDEIAARKAAVTAE